MNERHERAIGAIDAALETILSVGDQIHGRPEIGNEEVFASGLLCDTIEQFGFDVERGAGGMPTGFKARKRGKEGGPVIAFLAEYDALPGLGHGCGHNLIASSNLAAAIGAAAAVEDIAGEIQLIGTPAEENFGGKVTMIRNGAFDDVTVALSSHHGGDVTDVSIMAPEGTCLAVTPLIFRFYGQTAHAAMDPHKGKNALNGVLQLFNGIDALRQHVTPDVRMHGIITYGGDAPNVVPEFAEAHFLIRAAARTTVDTVVEQVRKIAEGAAMMTGTRVEIDDSNEQYDEMLPSYSIGKSLYAHFGDVGMIEHPVRGDGPTQTEAGAYSTDLGNVSQVVPTSMVSFAIADHPINGHSKDVVDGSISAFGREQAIKTGKILALTAVDLLEDQALVQAAQDEFALAKSN